MELIEKPVIKIVNTGDKLEIHPFFTNHEPEKIVDMDLFNYLLECKNKIEKVESIKKWDYFKKLSNPYELVSKYIKTKHLNLGIADYAPISRAFYKFWEIIHDFNIIDSNKKKIVFGALAEGPGGFVEAFSFYRRKYGGFLNDIINCITLKDYNDINIPGWESIKGCKYNIFWGEDGTGDLYKVKNILSFCNEFKNQKADLVSADGGFDFTNNYHNVERNTLRLIFCEIVTGLLILKHDGHMIIKIFDSFNMASVELLYLLHSFFMEIYITKPLTSRPANNEKYIICKYFKGIHNTDKDKLLDIVKLMEINKTKQIKNFFKIKIPRDFLEIINAYNIYSMKSQIYYILKSLLYTETKFLNCDINNIIKSQAVYAILWCKKYDFNINKKSQFLDKSKRYYFMPYFKSVNI